MDLNIELLPWQQDVWADDTRFKIVAAGRRTGKSRLAAWMLIVNALQAGLKERGFDLGETNSCVTPVYMKGSVPEAQALVYDMRENHNVFCSIVVPPVIPQGMILLRLIPTASHTLEDVQITLEAFSAVAVRLKAGDYKVEAANF